MVTELKNNMRVRFQKGKQREFFDLVIKKLNCISLRGILQFGLDVSYDCLKNYYTERRFMDKDFFDSLCYLSKIDKKDFKIVYLEDSWGQVKGGKS